MKITPQFIPHTEFHRGIWLLPVEGSKWYYFSKCENKNTIRNERFVESVDEPLKELVRYLHEKKISTTPSCSGHNFNKDYFEGVYSDLKKDENEIRNKGFFLKDIECGTIYFYKNKDYKLPWVRKIFVDFALHYQKKGVIGLRINHEKEKKQKVLELKIPGTRTEEKDAIVFVYTDPNDQPENKWIRITDEIKNIFRKEEEVHEKIKTPALNMF